jgi:hypothetical protein
MISFIEFLENQEGRIKGLLIILDDIFMSIPGTSRKIRYAIPFYDHGKWICYINPLKKKLGVEVVFLNGKSLIVKFPSLQTKGRRMVAGIEVMEVDESIVETIYEIFIFAANINIEKG